MNIRISHDTNQRLSIVALVIKATPAFITRKIETEARFLAMKPKVCLRPQLLLSGKSIRNFLYTKKTLQASPPESQRVNKSKFLKNYFAAS